MGISPFGRDVMECQCKTSQSDIREYLMGYIYITNHMIPAFPVDDVMGTVGEMAKWDMGYMSPHEELLCFMGKIWENNDQQ